MKLTDDELSLILFVLEAHSSNVKLKAASGKYNRVKADRLTKRMCDLSSKVYQEILNRDSQ